MKKRLAQRPNSDLREIWLAAACLAAYRYVLGDEFTDLAVDLEHEVYGVLERRRRADQVATEMFQLSSEQ